MHGKGISTSSQHALTVTMCNGEENQREKDEAFHDPAKKKDECMLPRYSPNFNNIIKTGECLEQNIKADGIMVTGNVSLHSSTSQGIAAAVLDGQNVMNTKGQRIADDVREVHASKQPTTVMNSKSLFGEGR
ncbi:hypothetical protein L2E82_35414 [Cichorium intybus]|uniref:Uncharacterized protein n=1 Tax=Cichorium intybus TaxID=13427 RepID=A0ACB9BNU1_CICIN|nr:hypothetical protein L2E82_35414 [Cichorium intybus]